MAEVHTELRVPFDPSPIFVEAWLREERPGEERLKVLIDSQPEAYRGALWRLVNDALAIIAEDNEPWAGDLAETETMMTFPAAAVEEAPTFAAALEAEREERAVAERMVADRDAEIAELRARIAERDAPTIVESVDLNETSAELADHLAEENVGDETPDEPPSPEALAASAAILDADPDDDELPDWDGSDAGAPAELPDAPDQDDPALADPDLDPENMP